MFLQVWLIVVVVQFLTIHLQWKKKPCNICRFRSSQSTDAQFRFCCCICKSRLLYGQFELSESGHVTRRFGFMLCCHVETHWGVHPSHYYSLIKEISCEDASVFQRLVRVNRSWEHVNTVCTYFLSMQFLGYEVSHPEYKSQIFSSHK